VACLYCPNHCVLFSTPLPNYVEAEITKTAILLSLQTDTEFFLQKPVKEQILWMLRKMVEYCAEYLDPSSKEATQWAGANYVWSYRIRTKPKLILSFSV